MTESPQGFLSQVLCSYDEVQVSSLTAMIEDVGSKIMNLKFQVKEMIEGTYVNFKQLPREHSQMVREAKTLSNEITQLSNKIEHETERNLRNSTKELKTLTDYFREVTVSASIVDQLVSIDDALKSAARLQANKSHGKVAKVLLQANEILASTIKHNYDVEILGALSEELTKISGKFLDDMKTVWNDCIIFQEPLPEDEPNVPSYSLLVDVSRLKEIEQMLQALHYFDHLDMYFEKFASQLYKRMVLPIIMEAASVKTGVEEHEKFMVLTIEINPLSEKSSYFEVFENLRKVFNFIKVNLKVENIEEDVSLIMKLGEIISGDLVKDLVEHCLADTIPCHSNKLDEFVTVVNDTSSIQTYFKVIGILKENDVTLLDYTKNVEYLCANKTCRTLLEKARTIMKKDLYDMKEVCVDASAKPIEIECDTHLEPSVKIDNNMFDFPKCKISKSAAELLDIIHQIIADCETSTDLCAVRLFYTARNIVELYCAIVPIHHEKFLETIPQQAALFHNNCMFVAHSLMTLGHEGRRKLPEVLHSHMTTFVDQVTEVRSIGTSIFLKHMKMQRDQILDIIRNSGLATLREKRAVAPDTEKAVRQCLRQLELLKTVWYNVLPVNVYCKSIGCLVNSFVDELIGRVTSVEDIPAEMATQLGLIFGVVTTRAPLLFPEPKEVHRYVAQWSKFLELIIILGASMKEITDRWANGKGPLALLYPPDQVRQLIRALFQNTDRRAAVLASIK